MGFAIQLSEQQARDVVELLNPMFLGTPRRSITHHASKKACADVVG